MFLEVHQLSKSFDGRPAIQDISFQLEKGKLLCLLGPSGCGKSTILNAIGGFIFPDQGHMILNGRDITHLVPEEREVATVFQSYGLFPHMTVLENIQYGLKFKNLSKKVRQEKALDMIHKMDLSGTEHKKVTQLSGGQQQRVALGRSLIIQPDLLLLDEPLSNLDAKLRVSLRDEIRRIQNAFQVTMIFVTHDQLEAFEIADEIILLSEGHIVQSGSAQDLYHHPNSTFALEFIGSNNWLEGRYVRPEEVLVSHKGPGLPGKIEGITFQGSTIKLLIGLANQELIESLVINQGSIWQIGDPVFVNYTARSL